MTRKSRPAKPRLGQNFLVNERASREIVAALGRDLDKRTIVEIGPGRGAITELLVRRAGRLVAIELDGYLAAALGAHFGDSVTVMGQDVLTVDISALEPDGEKLLVVGNLPYYITSDILLHLFAHVDAIETAVVMVQREVAERVAAAPGTRDYGLLSVTAQLYSEVEMLMTLPPTDFSPPPEVHSTVLRFRMRPRFDELGIAAGEFLGFVRGCFAQKRKNLRNNLRTAGYEATAIERACREACLTEDMRAENIGVEGLAALFRALKS